MTDPNYSMLQNPVVWVGTLLVAGFAALLLWVAWKCLNGTFRRWVLSPPIPFQISNRNTWPFMLMFAGIAVVVMLLSMPMEILGWESGRQFLVNGAVLVPIGAMILCVFHWPVALTPRWYRNWVRHPDYPNTSPWQPDEVSEVLALPAGKRRDRMIQDMAWCGIDIEKAWRDAGLPGQPPKSWLERKNESIQDEHTEAGITDDMDMFEKAAALRAHRQARKSRRAGRGG